MTFACTCRAHAVHMPCTCRAYAWPELDNLMCWCCVYVGKTVCSRYLVEVSGLGLGSGLGVGVGLLEVPVDGGGQLAEQLEQPVDLSEG